MTNTRKILRWCILALQLVAMVIFFVLPLLFGSYVSLLWYVMGILQTFVFCVVYFRMAKKRRIISSILMVMNTFFALLLLLVNLIMSTYGEWGTTTVIYSACIAFAVLLALFIPEKRTEAA